ncbi:YiiX/YebB-like N1pC/P60 family cysteine hydrolase [Clostridiaceae bacterium M8S5]|nr:YiiX/YebB-like N1pC/P60 family cysteine hydrolase [Clostridiaceae bacterium M8S5]
MNRNYIKTILILVLSIVVSLSSLSTTIAWANTLQNDLRSSYNELTNYALENNIPLNMSYDQFAKEYNSGSYSSVKKYTDVYYNLLKPSLNNRFVPSLTSDERISIRSSLGSPFSWQYNTGTSLPRKANYSKYNLLSVCQPGDLIYEAKGGFGITGHIAIVEGKFYDPILRQYYIRVIEANQYGVCRGVLDDDRIDRQNGHLYRLPGIDNTMQNNIIYFCKGQLGKPYWLDLAKDTGFYESNWYCSELAYAAYMNQGVNIETKSFFNEPGVSPRDIMRGRVVFEIPVYITEIK